MTGFDPANPAALVTANVVDSGVGAPRTHEAIVGFGKEMAGGIGFNASYIWRDYDNFIWHDTIGITFGRLFGGVVHAPVEHLPVRRPMRVGDLLRPQQDAADRLRQDEPARLSPRLQRLRVRDPQAFVPRLVR